MPKSSRLRLSETAPPAGTSRMSFSLDEAYEAAEEMPLNSFVDEVSADVKASRREMLLRPPPSPPSPPSFVPTLDADADASPPPVEETYQMDLWQGAESEDPPDSLGTAEDEPSAKAADRVMEEWRLEHRDEFLDLLLWHDGRQGATGACRRCLGSDPAVYRCRECGEELVCGTCCLDMHEAHPLHWLEEWGINGNPFFQRITLKNLGLRIQLGHPPRQRCSAPIPADPGFVVLHCNGIHPVAIDFCGCHLRRDAFYVQLLRRGFYPSTTYIPHTIATFECLDLFHTLSLKGKLTAYDYYATLEHLTHGAGIKPPDRYKPFLRMVRQWRHLHSLKRGGRGHEVGGVGATQEGELALRCPACPRPGVNLPPDWQDASPEQQGLYIMFIAIDACFRLKRRMVSSYARDPVLGPGWAYLVEWLRYRDYLATTSAQKEISTCTGLAALDHANTKFSRGYASTGVAMCICARHEFILPNGAGDLQKGERYANIDYIFASIRRHLSPLLRLMISYDVACQWWKSLKERLLLLPPLLRFSLVFALVRFVIPKLHIKAHVVACQLLFSLYLALGSGQTDGEGIERVWAMCGAIAPSTKLSGPGARAGHSDARRDNAIAELEKQEEAFAFLSEKQADRVAGWLAMVEAFEAPREPGAPEPPNPYAATVKGMSEQDVRKKFEAEHAMEIAAGKKTPIHDVSPMVFVTLGLDIETMQRKIRVQAELKRAQSAAATVNITELRRELNRSLNRLRTLQATYTPGALVQLATINIPQDALPEDVPPLLPSALSPVHRGTCVPEVIALEKSLREAQCRTAHVHLCNQLHVKAGLLLYKQYQSRHQGMNTRSRNLINTNESKIKLQAEKYQTSQRALRALVGRDPPGFPELRKGDIRCMDDAASTISGAGGQRQKDARRARREAQLIAEGDLPLYRLAEEDEGAKETDDSGDDAPTGESRRTMSWIWAGAGGAGTDSEVLEALRIEWAKAYARVRRWREEVPLVAEEWRRYPISLQFEIDKWNRRAKEAGSLAEPALAEGKAAYALKQAAIYRDLIRRGTLVMSQEKLKRGKARVRPAATADIFGKNYDDDDAGSETEDDERGDLDAEDEIEEDVEM
ncbi:CxC2 domain-containing protein [Mycena kentingensis (nom. inval.)]|nr:CxC2 domain-containing protein [Mycena kentingensis (nom. inval.)]